MASLPTHAIVGLSIGAAFDLLPSERARPGHRLAWTGLVLAMLPDADVLMHAFVRYGDFLGHRGFFHSPFWYLLAALPCAVLLARAGPQIKAPAEATAKTPLLLLALFVFLALLSHSILDAMTYARPGFGHGVMLYFPFSSGRHFLPWRPIPMSPMSLSRFLSAEGWRVVRIEILFALPCALVAFALMRRARLATRSSAASAEEGGA